MVLGIIAILLVPVVLLAFGLEGGWVTISPNPRGELYQDAQAVWQGLEVIMAISALMAVVAVSRGLQQRWS